MRKWFFPLKKFSLAPCDFLRCKLRLKPGFYVTNPSCTGNWCIYIKSEENLVTSRYILKSRLCAIAPPPPGGWTLKFVSSGLIFTICWSMNLPIASCLIPVDKFAVPWVIENGCAMLGYELPVIWNGKYRMSLVPRRTPRKHPCSIHERILC